jgi:hypothetical protein
MANEDQVSLMQNLEEIGADKVLKSAVWKRIDPSTQQLIKDILKAARESGKAHQDIDVDASASIFVGMIQSSVVFWALSDFSYSLRVRQAPLWREYLRLIR